MPGLVALALVVSAVALGVGGATWWAVPALAVPGLFVYGWLKGERFLDVTERGGFGFLATMYATQCVTMAIFFAVGRGIGSII